MLTFVLGTRPEVTKLRAVARECTRRGLAWQAIVTGQHTTLLEGFRDDPDFPVQWSLGLASTNDPETYVASLRTHLRAAYRLQGVTTVVVQGDTASAMAGALAGRDLHRTVHHIEAGVRTHDLSCPWPEEGFRTQIAALADWHYAATPGNVTNLLDEGVPKPRIRLTGNPGLDLLRPVLQQRPSPFTPFPRVLVTLHRRESHGLPLQRILAGLLATCQRFPAIEFLWPTHPHPAVQQALPAQPPLNLHLLPPLAPPAFVHLLQTSLAVLTDSGGVQEEASFLGIPAVIAREKTDRPESVADGTALLAGTTTDGVRTALHAALTHGLRAVPLPTFGDGHAAPKIVDHLQTLL